ncbi:AraC family transcriptional regulator [Cohnella sp. GCM10012308]|uniref:AraC family transcriptional regulator n=1 Tax=Cohnella sp. GCM10012308 TaxID=3317329 RepID=UPI00361128B1
MKEKNQVVRENKSIKRSVGFDDPYYFSRRFKLQMGIAPSAYQSQSRMRVVAVDFYGHLRALGIRPVGVCAHEQIFGTLHMGRFDVAPKGKRRPPVERFMTCLHRILRPPSGNNKKPFFCPREEWLFTCSDVLRWIKNLQLYMYFLRINDAC